MVQPSLSQIDRRNRNIMIEASQIFLKLDFVDFLVAAFFYAYSYQKYANAAFIAESLLKACETFKEVMEFDLRYTQKIKVYAREAKKQLEEMKMQEPIDEDFRMVDRCLATLKKTYYQVTKDLKKDNFDFALLLQIKLDSDVSPQEYATLLHQHDLEFLGSLKVSDFLIQPFGKFQVTF
mmetsp:Transcript_31240/g.30656  ORF Transcript_31240/g.30656 Transcript_31240/m.30656 type:complete len:179 (+) Transcript_31240:649-1185(+)